MIERPLWLHRIEETWKKAPIVWLSGVRRVGKTTLAHSLRDALHMNCDLPSVRTQLRDPEAFFKSVSHRVVVLDEVHQLEDPSQVLKIAADHFPKLRILATGSSTLAATHKFKDSLTGRKRAIHLLPVLLSELHAFGIRDLRKRLFHGGLPPALLAEEKDEGFYSEWLDSYYARDVQELFRIEKRKNFLLLVETLLRQNAGMVDVNNLADMCSLSRPTIMNYLEVLELTHVICLLRPYHGGGKQELVRQQRVYGFDTGFVSHAKGWGELRTEDCGLLWENIVLEHLMSLPSSPKIFFWRDKQQREVDYVIPQSRDVCHAIECKWNPDRFETKSLKAFRDLHPKGKNFVIAPNIERSYTRRVNGFEIVYASPQDLDLH